MRRAFRNPDLQACFEREGFVKISLLTREEVAGLQSAAERLLPSDPKINDPQGCAYLSYFDLERREIASTAIRSAVAVRLEEALVDYRPLYSTFFLKHANAGELPLHQHAPYIADFDDTVINCWCPLIDCDAQSGTLQIVPRTHQLLRHVQTPQTPHYWNGFVDQVRERHLTTIPVAAGEAVLFEDSMPHGSTANRRDAARLATLTTLIPKAAVPAFFVGRGDDADAYAAVDDFCYSDYFHGRLPPPGEWRRLATVTDAVARIGIVEFEERLAARNAGASPVAGGSRLWKRVSRILHRSGRC